MVITAISKIMDRIFFYQQKYEYIIYSSKISTSGTVVFTSLIDYVLSYGVLIQSVVQELDSHRSECN